MKIALFLCACLLAGCSLFVTPPEVAVKDVNVVGIDAAGLDVEFYLGVKNPNPFAVTLTGYSYDVQVMTLPVAKGGSRDAVRFEPKRETDVRLPVRLRYTDLLEILKRRPDPDRIPYRLAAGLELDSPLGGMLVPVEKNATFAIPDGYRPTKALKKLTDLLGGFDK